MDYVEPRESAGRQAPTEPFKLTDGHRLYLLVKPSGSKLWKRLYSSPTRVRADLGRHAHVCAVGAHGLRGTAIEADEDILSLDIGLRRNDPDWAEDLPELISPDVLRRLHYGHFLCHVFHRDYIVRKGADLAAMKRILLDNVSRAGGHYPAEHNFGHQYAADPATLDHYRALDPTNSLNPGTGRASKNRMWAG